MRAALLTISLIASSRFAAAQSAESECAPRVEASETVPASVVSRVTAAVSSGPLVCRASSLVRFDVVAGHLVMTAVLNDGRQIARVLPSPADALPTLVALTADPIAPSAPTTQTPPEAAPPVELAPALVPDLPLAPSPPPAVATRRSATDDDPSPWSWRLGASVGISGLREDPSPRADVDVDLLSSAWAFGLRATVAPGEHETSTAAVGSMRRRWSWSRWSFDVGGAAGARWSFTEDESPHTSLLLGVESSLGFVLLRHLSAFVRVEVGADLFGRGAHQRGDDDDDARAYYGAVAGVRWEFSR